MIALSKRLLNQAQSERQTIQDSEQWRSNAELHAGRIFAAKDIYLKLEHEMRVLIARERMADSPVEKSQIAVRVNQGSVAGTQADLQLNQIWDRAIEDPGRILSRRFSFFASDCTSTGRVEKGGATIEAVEVWKDACRKGQAERSKFEPMFNHVEELRTDLKFFEAKAQSNRQALVEEANRIQSF